MNEKKKDRNSRSSSLRSLLYLFLIGVTVGGAVPLIAQEQDGDNAGLEIIPTTYNNSAAVARRLQEGPSISSQEVEEDMHRKELGIGERVSLELTNKLKGKDEDVEWDYVGEAAKYVMLPDKKKGNPIRLTVKKDLAANQSVTIQAKTGAGDTKNITFEIKIPRQFSATHAKVNSHDPADTRAGIVPELKDNTGNIINPQPGETGTIGASAELTVTVLPVSVSFKDLPVIERANDPPGFIPTHNPNPQPMILSDSNRFPDYIMARSSSRPSDPVPAGWSWHCAFRLVDDQGSDGLLITGRDVIQTVSFARTGSGPDMGVETTVEKFGCSVSRDSRTGEHRFTPDNYRP